MNLNLEQKESYWLLWDKYKNRMRFSSSWAEAQPLPSCFDCVLAFLMKSQIKFDIECYNMCMHWRVMWKGLKITRGNVSTVFSIQPISESCFLAGQRKQMALITAYVVVAAVAVRYPTFQLLNFHFPFYFMKVHASFQNPASGLIDGVKLK